MIIAKVDDVWEINGEKYRVFSVKGNEVLLHNAIGEIRTVKIYVDMALEEAKEVIVVPTIDTSWGIEDRYNLEDYNEKIIYERLTVEEIKQLVREEKIIIVGGEKYVY